MEITGWIPGLRACRDLVCDGPQLFCLEAEAVSVWDAATGDRLHREPGLTPISWHPTGRHFLTIGEDGDFV